MVPLQLRLSPVNVKLPHHSQKLQAGRLKQSISRDNHVNLDPWTFAWQA